MPQAQTIFGIALLIILHEAGHYLVAVASGMRVLRFSLGFGPPLFARRRGETIWQVAAIPLGGFVQIDGLGPAAEGEAQPVDDGRSYRNKPAWQRMAVIFAGPAANWILAFLFLWAALFLGMFRPDGTSRLGEVMPESAAARAGLVAGDEIIAIDGVPLSDWNGLVTTVQQHPEQSLSLQVRRGSETLTLTAQPERDGTVGRLGVTPATIRVRMSFFEAAGAAFTGTLEATARYASLLWNIVSGRGGGRLSGLPGIVKMVSAQAEAGLGALFASLAELSIGLCLLNLAPFPALDGGRLLFLIFEKVRGRRLDEKLEGMIHAAGSLALFALLIFVSVRDLLS